MAKIEQLYPLLAQLKSGYSEELANQTLNVFLNINPKEILNDSTLQVESFNDLEDEFYELLVSNFVKDMEKNPVLFFFDWYFRLKLLTGNSLAYFYSNSRKQAIESTQKDFIQGICNFYEKRYDEAFECLVDSNSFLVDYFLGCIHFYKDENKDCVLRMESFINNLENTFSNDFTALEELVLFEWHAFVLKGNAHTFTKHFEDALLSFNDSTELAPLNQAYEIMTSLNLENKRNNFANFAANYLKVLSKGANPERYNELLDFAKEKYPESSYFSDKPYAVAAPK